MLHKELPPPTSATKQLNVHIDQRRNLALARIARRHGLALGRTYTKQAVLFHSLGPREVSMFQPCVGLILPLRSANLPFERSSSISASAHLNAGSLSFRLPAPVHAA